MILMHFTMVEVINTLFMHKGKKITLLPLTPAKIVESDRERLANDKIKAPVESEIHHVTKQIKLKNLVLLVTKTDPTEIRDDDAICYAFVCRDALFSLDNLPSTLPPAITNLL
jgi:hypothetical protein